nr:PD40 domain-containing protein [Chloroflexota bacterium]
MYKRAWFRSLLLLLLVLAMASCALLQQYKQELWPSTLATPTTAVILTQGQIRDAITKLPIVAARLQAGTVTALSDVEGAFCIPSLGEEMITITAAGYETAQIRPRAGFPLVVDLIPDASTTFQIIYNYERQHEFGRQYELLHPDVQILFSREEFIRYMEQQRPYDLIDFSVGPVDMLASGVMLGKVYNDVAQVRVQATVRSNGRIMQRSWLGYAAKAGGLWRWFRGPLLWPTLTPVSTDTPTPTATPTQIPTSPPRSTNTPILTAVASPTPYEPISPGSQAVVISDVAGLHTGTGEEYAVILGMPRGTKVLALEWPRWVDGVPWYRVQVVGTSHTGWCKGSNLAALLAVTTPTIPPATPTARPVTPAVQIMPRIAFTSERDGDQEVYVMNADGSDLRNLTLNPAQDGNPSWSPTHDRLAFVSDRTGNSDIFLMNADGSGVVQITFSPADEIHPAWSPNGAFIAYVSNEDGDWEIFVMNATGGGAMQLTHNTAWDSYPSWSPDSQKMVFTSERDGNYELYLYDLTSYTETRLTDHPASDAFPAWSPTGQEIAFTSARDGALELYLLDLVAIPQRITRLTYTVPASAANRYPSWANDGNWLAFTSWRDGNAEIYIVRRDGWWLRNLTMHPAADEFPAWAD